MQLIRMLTIAGLAGLFCGGLVWLGWDVVLIGANLLRDFRRRRRIQAEEAALKEDGGKKS